MSDLTYCRPWCWFWGPTGPTGPTGTTGATGPTGPSGGTVLRDAAAVSDATGTGDIVTQFNELLANLRSVGILAEQ